MLKWITENDLDYKAQHGDWRYYGWQKADGEWSVKCLCRSSDAEGSGVGATLDDAAAMAMGYAMIEEIANECTTA